MTDRIAVAREIVDAICERIDHCLYRGMETEARDLMIPILAEALARARQEGAEEMRPMDDPALEALKASGAPVLLLYPADTLPHGMPLPAAWLIDRWSERGWQHRSARWADPVGWMALPPITQP